MRSPILIPQFSPRLKTPLPLGLDGQPIKPVPEQSFIQKYWIYIVPALIIMRKLPPLPSCRPTHHLNVSSRPPSWSRRRPPAVMEMVACIILVAFFHVYVIYSPLGRPESIIANLFSLLSCGRSIGLCVPQPFIRPPREVNPHQWGCWLHRRHETGVVPSLARWPARMVACDTPPTAVAQTRSRPDR